MDSNPIFCLHLLNAADVSSAIQPMSLSVVKLFYLRDKENPTFVFFPDVVVFASPVLFNNFRDCRRKLVNDKHKFICPINTHLVQQVSTTLVSQFKTKIGNQRNVKYTTSA